MRGQDDRSEVFFSYMRLDDRIPADHPLRAIRQLVDAALAELSRAFAKLYARDGRPSIAPERLLRTLLLQAFYTVRGESLRAIALGLDERGIPAARGGKWS